MIRPQCLDAFGVAEISALRRFRTLKNPNCRVTYSAYWPDAFDAVKRFSIMQDQLRSIAMSGRSDRD